MGEIIWDIVVVGGGPAGSTTAYLLAKSGFSVLLLEKQTFPRPKLCAGLITKKTVGLLNQIFQVDIDFLKSNGILLAESRDYSILCRDKSLVSGYLDFPFHMIERSRYDHIWLKMAMAAGVRVETGDAVNAIDMKTRTLNTESGDKFSGKYIIGADGAFSRTKTELVHQGLITKKVKDPAMGLETYLTHNSTNQLPSHPAIVFGFVRGGYAWSFPQGDQFVLGICGPKIHKGPGLKNRLLAFLNIMHIDPADCQKLKGHPLPYGSYMKKPGADNTLLVGDAAGYADPLLGEGLYYAHASALLAAEAVVAVEKQGGSAAQLYFHALQPAILREMRYARIIQWCVQTLLSPWKFTLFGLGMRVFKKRVEETIQGDRSFAWLRKKEPLAKRS